MPPSVSHTRLRARTRLQADTRFWVHTRAFVFIHAFAPTHANTPAHALDPTHANTLTHFRLLPQSFARTVREFATAVRQNSRMAYVLVGGSAATFGYGPGYDASVAFVLAILREEGIPCSNAPETHGMRLGSDAIHFDSRHIDELVDMWRKAVRSSNSPLLLLVCARSGGG